MNGVRMVTLKFFRTYASKPKSDAVGIKGKLMLTQMEGSEHDPEDFDHDDIDEFESDFMNVHVSHKLHEREIQKSRDLLKQRITRSKYFKDQQPRFLTYVEKDQIQNLHKSNPKEWTPEKLSESFPALPETIRKILKSKWVPQSVDSVINYDKLAIENWKNFKTGKLVVDPALNQHLMKFRNRKISLTDRRTLSEKFVPPKMEFPQPASTMFSSIVNDASVSSKQPMYKEKQTSWNKYPDKDKSRVATINETSKEMSVIQRYNITNKEQNKEKKYKNEGKLTINEFMKEKLRTLYETSPEEGITLLYTYRKYIESRTSEDISANVLAGVKKEAEVEEDITANVLAGGGKEAEIEEDISSNVVVGAKKEAEVEEDISANVLAGSGKEAEIEEDISANVVAGAKKEAEVEEDISANVLAGGGKEAEIEEDISANVVAGAKKVAEVEEDISANVLAGGGKEAEVEEDITANVLASAKPEAEVEEYITANVVAGVIKEAEVEEDISANVLAGGEKEAEVEEDISVNVLAGGEQEAEVKEDITANVVDKSRVATINETSKEMSVMQRYNITNKKQNKEKKYKNEGKLIINEFMKEKLRTLYETSPEEGITLLYTYRKYIESRTSEDISANVLAGAKKEAEVEEDISANVLAGGEKEAEVEEDITANVVAGAKKEAEVEEDISANVLAGGEKEAEVEEDITANVVAGAKKEAEVEEDISANVLAGGEKEAEDEEDITANVVACAKKEAEVEEDISANVLAGGEKEAEVEEDITANVLASSKKEAEVEEENVPLVKIPRKETALTPIAKQTQARLPVELDTESSSLDTYVKEWNSSVETKFDYAKSIRIPRNVYKAGMLYRIKDCYYDDDGEFLYRVPGVRG